MQSRKQRKERLFNLIGKRALDDLEKSYQKLIETYKLPKITVGELLEAHYWERKIGICTEPDYFGKKYGYRIPEELVDKRSILPYHGALQVLYKTHIYTAAQAVEDLLKLLGRKIDVNVDIPLENFIKKVRNTIYH